MLHLLHGILFTICLVIFKVNGIQNQNAIKVQNNTSDDFDEDNLISPNFVLPKQIFNDGKPFYLEKDPISGKLDFNSKKSISIETDINEVINENEKNIILNRSGPNIHDYLNLPVKYSSSKFVYPLVSSSYANLKYQGNNKNYISNHKDYIATTPPKYFLHKKMNTTRLRPATELIQKTSVNATNSKKIRPADFSSINFNSSPKYTTLGKITTTTSTTIKTTPTSPNIIITEGTMSTEKLPVTTQSLTTSSISSNQDIKMDSTTKFTTISTTSTVSAPSSVSTASSTKDLQKTKLTTNNSPSFKPIPTTISPVDIYNAVNKKKDPNEMSLSDLFSSLVDEMTFSQNQEEHNLDLQDGLMHSLPAVQPAPFLPQLTVNSTSIKAINSSFENKPNSISQADIEDYGDSYVHYEAQKPNVLKFPPVSNMNNIIISPGQNSASFVLGSQQSFSTNVLPTDNQEKVQRVQYGTVINENLTPNDYNLGNYPPAYHLSNEQGQSKQNYTQQNFTELSVLNNIKFPNDLLYNVDIYNYGAQNPTSLPLNQQQHNSLSFSNGYKNEQTHTRKPYDQASNNEVLTLNQKHQQNKISFPQLPSKASSGQPLDILPVEESNIYRRPHFSNQQGQYFPHRTYNEYKKKTIQNVRRQNQERPLPNILPQFRPNAKIGHATYSKGPGNMVYNRPQIRPSFVNHRQPNLQRINQNIGSEQIEANRRIYKVPPSSPNRIAIQQNLRTPPNSPYNRYFNNNPSEKHAVNGQSFSSENYNMENSSNFDADLNDGPQLQTTITKNEKDLSKPKLEPVVTLQMLQTKKKTLSGDNDTIKVSQKTETAKSPIYVVYPVKTSPVQMDMSSLTNLEDPIVIGQRGEQLPSPPSEFNQSGTNLDYQNTPFSVVRDQPQEPILMVKNKSQNRGIFPYPLERPDPAINDFNKQHELERFDRNTDSVHLPRIINQINNKPNDVSVGIKESPIAIAYTPTEANWHFNDYQNDKRFSIPNLASQVIPEIRETQTETSFNDDLDVRGQNFEKDFMAPFYPSISLSEVTGPQNSWTVPTVTNKPNGVFEKNSINRADISGFVSKDTNIDKTTKKFDLNNFQPELQSGFKPIYPPDYKISTSSEEIESNTNLKLLNTTEINNNINNSNILQKTKSKLEMTIESLLFGDENILENTGEQGSGKS